MSTHPRPPFCTRRWLVLAAWAGACVGTPTPEPPDNLPAPDGDRIFVMSTISTDSPEVLSTLVPLSGQARSVAPNTDLWIVNLDDPNAAPLTVRASSTGSFNTKVAANMGDRLRLVSRSARQHSLPLDAVYGNGVDSSNVRPMVSILPLPPQDLSCLQVAPASEISVVVSATKPRDESFVLTNGCASTVQITNASLRFGDQGFSLATPPESVPVNRSASLTITFDGHDDDTEHADILLLDVEAANGQVGRYALGVWSLSSSARGSD